MAELLNKQHRYPSPIIEMAVAWYQKYPLPYRTISEMLTNHGVTVSHKTVYEWVTKFGDSVKKKQKKVAASTGKWSISEENVKVNGEAKHMYCAVDAQGNVLNVVVRSQRNSTSAQTFLKKTLDQYSVKFSDKN